MPTTLTLKNIPDDVYDRLKASAEAHRRSLNSEAIVCLESVLLPGRVAPANGWRGRAHLRAHCRRASSGARHRRHEARRPRMIVVDTNVVAYLYLPGDYTEQAEALARAGSGLGGPVLWRSEFRNILAGYMRRGTLTFEQARDLQPKPKSLLAGANTRWIRARAGTGARQRLLGVRLRVRCAGACNSAWSW